MIKITPLTKKKKLTSKELKLEYKKNKRKEAMLHRLNFLLY